MSAVSARAGRALFLIAICFQLQSLSAQTLLRHVEQISAGRDYTCAVLDDNTITCWGANQAGQLGNGSVVDRQFPEGVVTNGPVKAVAAGSLHTCALVGGGIECWGDNQFGQLGNGTTVPSLTPHLVSGIPGGATNVATGYAHTCAVVAGGAKCWGNNYDGEVGNGTADLAILEPTVVNGLASGVGEVSTGSNFSCALVSGAAKCWGNNAYGQIGDGSFLPRGVPMQVSGLESGVTHIASNMLMSCAIVQGGLKCWGFGVLGDGNFENNGIPVDVLGPGSGVVAVTLGNDVYGHVCATLSDNRSYCWGMNSYGQYGYGGFELAYVPLDVGLTQFTPGTMTAGGSHTCALANGVAYCWGSNTSGQLGIGQTPLSSLMPGAIHNLQGAHLDMRVGAQNACAIAEGALSCWGANNDGQLGDGTHLPRSVPMGVVGLGSGVTDVSVNVRHACAVMDGGVYCWGNNESGQLGDGSAISHDLAAQVFGLGIGAQQVAVGSNHSCAIAGGHVKCWGSIPYLGGGPGLPDGTEPIDVIGITNATAIAAGESHTCVIEDGAVKCWGFGGNGQLGNGSFSTVFVLEPTQVVGLTGGATAIAAAGSITCAIVDGGATCWGYNFDGELGNGFSPDSNVPVPVTGLGSGVLSITTGAYHACAMTTNGTRCWGDNSGGELGTGTAGMASHVPVDASVLPPDAISIVAGMFVTCAITSDGGACWGTNRAGQLGTGGIPWVPTPQAVIMRDSIFEDGFEG